MRISIDSFAVFLLPLSNEFGWARSEAVSIYGLTMFSFGFGCLLAGRMMDRFGPRRTYSAGLLAIASVFLIASHLDALWQFALCMGVVVGTGAALIGMVSHAVLLSHWFRDRLTFAISFSFAASGLGMLIGAPVLQSLIEKHGWRSAYTSLGTCIAVLAVIIPFLPWRRMVYRLDETPVRQARGSDRAARVTFGAVLMDKGLVALFAIQFLTAISLFSLNPQIVAFFVEQGFDPVNSALAYGAAGVAGSVGVVAFGWLADKRGRQIAMTLSYVMTVGGFSMLLATLAQPSWTLVILFVIVYGPTFGSRGPIVNAMVPAMVGRGPGLGFKVGFVQLGMGLGAAVGSTSGGWMRDINGYEGVILLAMISGIGALVLYWSVKNIRDL